MSEWLTDCINKRYGLVCVHDSGWVLTEPQHSAVFKLSMDQPLDQLLRFQVHRRKGLFHKEDFDPCKQGSSQT